MLNLMFSWFPYSVAATILLGLSMVGYKFPAAKNVNRYGVSFWSLAVSVLFSFLFFSNFLSHEDQHMLWWAALWGMSFAGLSLLQMYALTHVDTNALFPVTSTLSLVITIILGFLLFAHDVHLLQVVGIMFSVVAVFLFLYQGGRLQYSRHVLTVGVTIIFLSALNKVTQKVVADGFDIRAFQVYQYLFASLFSLFVYFVAQKSFTLNALFERKQIALGMLIGLPGFFGGYALLTALTKGPFALIFSIHSLYIFIVAFAGYFFLKEQLPPRKIVALVVAVCALVLIRVG